MKIRRCTEMDIKRVTEIFLESWRRTYSELLPKEYLASLTNEQLHKKWSDYIKKENYGIFVALSEEEEVVAFIAYSVFEDIENCLYLSSLHVDLNCQGKGIGKELIVEVAKFGVDNGYLSMVVDIIKGNERAENVYKHLGAEFYREFAEQFDEDLYIDSVAYIWNDINVILI